MFEHKWMMEEDFKVIMEKWQLGDQVSDLSSKLTQFSDVLRSWAGSRFDAMPRKISSLRRELNQLMNPMLAQDNAARIYQLEHEIDKLVSQEEMHWQQLARANWLAHGDGNTKFFHSVASQRQRINSIKGLVDEYCVWRYEERPMANILLKYFATLFTSDNPSNLDIEDVISNLKPTVDDSMNSILCAPFTEVEVRKALFDMHPSKAPGPDGYTALFFSEKLGSCGARDYCSGSKSVK